MPESKELHKQREKIRYELRKKHPDWNSDQIRIEISAQLEEFKRGQKGSKSGSKVQKSVQGSSESSNPKPERTGNVNSSESGSKKFRTGSESTYPRIWIKLDHSVDKSQYVLSESLDGLSWKYSATLTKGQPFERNGVIILPTWHKGSTKEGDGI